MASNLSSRANEALRDADTVALVFHGVGDHRATDIVREATKGPASIWGDKADISKIQIEGIPVPEDVAEIGRFREEPAVALQILADSRRHLVIPIIWSGIHSRAARWAAMFEGPQALFNSLPILIVICVNLFRCVPRARGPWKLGVLGVASFSSVLLAGSTVGTFYLAVHLPLWFGAPYYPHWYLIPLALGSFALLKALAVRFSVVLDLVGDVAAYVARKELRSQNLQKMGALIQFVAETAPSASILVVGHSLGSVLVSQSLADLPSTYAGRGRTVLLTMGSPLSLMSRVFPSHIQPPKQLLQRSRSFGSIVAWVNLWRTRDIIGKALIGVPEECFAEAPLGIGGHGNYWGDGRVWLAVARIMRDPASANLSQLDQEWKTLPLPNNEEREALELWNRLRLLGTLGRILFFWTLFFQIRYLAPWEKQFAASTHVLIFVVWNTASLGLAFAGLMPLWRVSAATTPYDFLYNARFAFGLARPLMMFSTAVLAIISGIRAWGPFGGD